MIPRDKMNFFFFYSSSLIFSMIEIFLPTRSNMTSTISLYSMSIDDFKNKHVIFQGQSVMPTILKQQNKKCLLLSFSDMIHNTEYSKCGVKYGYFARGGHSNGKRGYQARSSMDSQKAP